MVASTKRILIMAGGTGGHIFPALAVAEHLRRHDHQVFWVGTRAGLEAEVVPRAGFTVEYISVKGLRGKGVFGWLMAPFRLLLALGQTWCIFRRIQPAVALGMGGFVTGPGGVVGWLRRVPLVIHEQNAIPGLTNRVLARIAKRVLQAFPGSFNSAVHAHTIGNPVRETILKLNAVTDRYQTRQGAIRILIIGGSLGAQILNDTVPAAIAMIEKTERPLIWHQAGKQKNIPTQRHYDNCAVEARVEPFIVNIAEAYAWADLVICRAGAMTVSELSHAGLASILVPYPYAVDDHQTANARVLSDNEAAILIKQTNLTAETLAKVIRELIRMGRTRLMQMASAAQKFARSDATQQVAQHCLEVARG